MAICCSRCKREVKKYIPDANVEKVICEKCLMAVVNEVDRLKLTSFSVNGLYWALRRGDLKDWMKRNDVNISSIETLTGVSRNFFLEWMKKWKKEDDNQNGTTDIKTADIKASIYAVLREAQGKTHPMTKGWAILS